MSTALAITTLVLTVISGLLAVSSVVTLRLTRKRWEARVTEWRLDEARRVLIQVEYKGGKRKVIADVPARKDETSVRAIDHAVRDLSEVSREESPSGPSHFAWR